MPVITARPTSTPTPTPIPVPAPVRGERLPARDRAAPAGAAFASAASARRVAAITPGVADRCVAALSLLVLLATGIDAGWR